MSGDFKNYQSAMRRSLLIVKSFIVGAVSVITIQAALASVAQNPTSGSGIGGTFTTDVHQTVPQASITGQSFVFPQFSAVNIRGIIINQIAGDTLPEDNPIQLYDDTQVWGRLNVLSGLRNTGTAAAPR